MNPDNIDQNIKQIQGRPLSLLNQLCLIVACLGLVLWLQGCGRSVEQASNEVKQDTNGKALIMTVNAPLKYMAERIADHSWANTIFPADSSVADPAFWNPSPDIIRRYQEADLILLNGAGYARWILTASLKVSSLHDTAATFNAPFIKLEDAIIHQHGPEGEHSHEGFATTTWLDFELAAQHANSIFLAMKKRWPEHTDSMQNNHALLQKDLKELHDAMLEIKKQIGNIPLLASHPVYQYATRAYNLNIHSLHWEPDATPDANEWQTFDMFLSNNPTKWMIWEDTPTKETQAKLSQRNIEWIVFRPQGGAIKNDDFLSIMRANIEALKSIKP